MPEVLISTHKVTDSGTNGHRNERSQCLSQPPSRANANISNSRHGHFAFVTHKKYVNTSFTECAANFLLRHHSHYEGGSLNPIPSHANPAFVLIHSFPPLLPACTVSRQSIRIEFSCLQRHSITLVNDMISLYGLDIP
jgi:hypothetical protein